MVILRAANSWAMNIIVIVGVLCLVIGLPIIDRRVCKKLGLSLSHGLSTNPNAESLMLRRKLVLYGIFALYLLANLYLVFVSRAEADTYSVHTDLMVDLANSVTFDLGVFGTFEEMIASGFRKGVKHIHVVKAADIMQVLMNIMLYVPMGYLLPYCFKRFQGSRRMTVFVCFLFSFITENVQLIFRRGTYDLDDLVFNTLGGLLGYMLYKTFAYYVTNPGWRRQLRRYNRWRLHARRKPLYPFAYKMRGGRSTLFTADMRTATHYYTDYLGFRLSEARKSGDYIVSEYLQLGGVGIELRLISETDFPQQLVICVDNLDKVRKRLDKAGIPTSDFALDVYSHHRKLEIEGPDNTVIVFTE